MIWSLVLAVHLLAAVFWVGGLAFLLVVLRPSLAVLEQDQRLALRLQVFRRFFLITWHAMPLALLSGYAMLFGVYGGFAGVGWNVHVMHLFGLIMAALFLLLFFGPWAAMRRQPTVEAVARIRTLAFATLVLGVLTVAVAAVGMIG